MQRWGSGERFLEAIEGIRGREPAAVFRSSFIVGFPGETEDDHEELIGFLEEAALDWVGFFAFCAEEGTPAATLDGQVDEALVGERLRELSEIQDAFTRSARDAVVGERVEVLVDGIEDGEPVGRTFREAPEIDGLVRLAGAEDPSPGSVVEAVVTRAEGIDLLAVAGEAA
jgi:ribosomal protein S12 methylthiotransferase